MAKASTTKGNNNNMTDNTTPTTGKQTLDQRIEATEKLLAKYKALKNALAQINNVQVGDTGVTFKFGRSDKARTEVGTVIGMSDTAQGKLVAIQTGEGIDIAVRKVRAADIISNPSADERNGETAEGGEGADPLAAE